MNFYLFSPLKNNCRCIPRYCTLASKNLPSIQESKGSKILHFFNKAEKNELEQHNIGEKYISRLIQHRERYGVFKTLSELITVTGIGVDKLQKVSKKTSTNKKSNKTQAANKLIINPVVSPEACGNIKSVVGLDLTLPYLTVSHLSRDMVLHSWERIPVSNDLKYDIHACYSEAIDLVSRIPEADIYLMEQKRLRAKHLTHVPYMIRQTALESFILSQFKHSEDILPTHLKVVTIKNSSLSSVFQIQVGNERVTGQDIIHKLLNKETVPFLPSLPKMSCGPALRELYFRSNLTDKEFMCNSLLLCLAFYEHIVFKVENNRL
ncbi:transcription elongation factor, mitochondrial [Centruroides vittatus]|uniref:transcription elongation factor, mitochondrial n=1 Tax=Centruroides vittatus TaxID=120091 RepID=UPI00350F641A